MKQAREMAPASDLVITVDKDDRSKIGNTESKVETRSIGGGLVISSKNGDISIDATVDRLIDSKSDEIRNALLEELFGSVKRQNAAPKKAAIAKRPHKAAAKKPTKAKKSKK
jgi:vacuolar-type H+-ATPase subunit E/Vma4